MVIRINPNVLLQNPEKALHLSIAGCLLQPMYFFMLGTALNIFGFETTLFTYIFYGAVWLLQILALPWILRKFTKMTVLGIVAVLLLAFLQWLIFPKNKEYIVGFDPMSVFALQPHSLVTAAPYILLGLAVTDPENLKNTLHKTARIGITLGVLAYALSIANEEELRYDDMSNAYGLCLLLCVLILDLRKRDIWFVTFGILAVILAGTRGPLLCIMVAFIMRMIWMEKDLRKKILKISVCLLLFLALSSGLLVWFLELISEMFAAIGVKELRIVDYMRDGMLTDSSGRDTLSNVLWNKIAEAPILGYGIGGDRLLLPKGAYAHNIFLELWSWLGMIGGTVAILWIGFTLISAMLSGSTSYRTVIVALVSAVFVKLLFSSSLLLSKEFMILLGMCIDNVYRKPFTQRHRLETAATDSSDD